jgi:hypothetical protein
MNQELHHKLCVTLLHTLSSYKITEEVVDPFINMAGTAFIAQLRCRFQFVLAKSGDQWLLRLKSPGPKIQVEQVVLLVRIVWKGNS